MQKHMFVDASHCANHRIEFADTFLRLAEILLPVTAHVMFESEANTNKIKNKMKDMKTQKNGVLAC